MGPDEPPTAPHRQYILKSLVCSNPFFHEYLFALTDRILELKPLIRHLLPHAGASIPSIPFDPFPMFFQSNIR